MERLDKFLCDCGVGTRSQVKQILKAGRVSVDGKAEKDPAKKVSQDSCICLDGEQLGSNHMTIRVKPATDKGGRKEVSP